MRGLQYRVLTRSLFRLTFILLCLLVLMPKVSLAVNFYDGARAQGTYFLTYSSVYTADETTDKNGSTSKKDYGFLNAQNCSVCAIIHPILSQPLLFLLAIRIFTP